MFSTKVMGILALAAAVFCVVLIGLQVAELMYYSADPSVWPAV